MARCQPHQHDRQQWPEDSAHGIERLTQAERCAAQLDRRNIGHQRIAGCPPNAFADTVDEACRSQPLKSGGHGKYRLHQRTQAIADHCQQLAFTQSVAEGAREHLGERCGRLGDSFDKPHRYHRSAEHTDHVQRQ
ncbi:hypothetical protein D3C80_991710 [compost metagenome]